MKRAEQEIINSFIFDELFTTVIENGEEHAMTTVETVIEELARRKCDIGYDREEDD